MWIIELFTNQLYVVQRKMSTCEFEQFRLFMMKFKFNTFYIGIFSSWQKCFDDLLANIKHEKNENWQNCIVQLWQGMMKNCVFPVGDLQWDAKCHEYWCPIPSPHNVHSLSMSVIWALKRLCGFHFPVFHRKHNRDKDSQSCDSLFSSMQCSQIIAPAHRTDEWLRPVEHSKFDDARRANFTSIAPPAGDMDTAFVDTDGNGGSDGDDGNVCNDGNGDEINTETGSPIATSVVLRLQYSWFDVGAVIMCGNKGIFVPQSEHHEVVFRFVAD